jgi:TP901 family phage tail tape measure protein
MAREAKTVYTIDPALAIAAIKQIETAASQSTTRIATAYQRAIGGSGTGRGRGGGGTGSGGGGGSPTGEGFFSSFSTGFGRAGGFGSALATVVKYGAAYKAVEAGMTALLTPLNLTQQFLQRGTKAWFEYDAAMSMAERTMQMPGMKPDLLKQVLGADALDFMTHYNVTIQDASKAIYELGSAGASSASVMQTWKTAAKLNVALGGDMTQTTRLLTQMLKIHGDTMGKGISENEKMIRISGILAKTWQIEQVELSDFAAAYKYVAGNASALKIKVEELIPLIGFLSTYGLRGSIAGTGLNQFLTQIARTVSVTKDGLIELHKVTRGGEIVVKTGVKAPDVKGPIQMLEALAKAAKAAPDATWIEKLEGVGKLADLLNIRGARPAQQIMARLAEFMARIGDTSRMTTAQLQKFVEELVRIQQNNAPAQIALLNNSVNIAAQRFIMAAVGADTFVNALIAVRKWVLEVTPAVEGFGRELHAAGAFWNSFLLKGNDISTAGEAASKARQEGATNAIYGEAATAYLTDPKGFGMWRAKRVREIRASVEKRPHAGNILATDLPGLGGDTITQRVISAKALRAKGEFGYADDYDLARLLALDTLKGNLKPIVDLAARQKQEKLAAPNIGDQIKSAMAGITKTPTAGGGAGTSQTAKDTRDAITRITDRTLDYKDAVEIVSESLRRMEIEEQRLSKTIGTRLITNAQVLASDKLAGEQLKTSADLVVVLRAEQGQLAKNQADLEKTARTAPDQQTRSRATREAASAHIEQLRITTRIAEEEDKQTTIRERGSALRIDRTSAQRQRATETYERQGYTRERVMKANEDALKALDRTEALYGETVASQRARIDLLNASTMLLTSNREREEAHLAGLTAEYAKLQGQLKGMEVAGITGKTYDELYARLLAVEDAMKSSRSAIDGQTASMLDNDTAVQKVTQSLRSAGLATALDIVIAKWEIMRDTVEATGADWSTSMQRGIEGTQKFAAVWAVAQGKLADLEATPGLSPDEYMKRKLGILAEPGKALNELTRYRTDLRKAAEGISNDMEDMRDSWGKGDEGANRVIERKAKAMREQYAGNPELLKMVGQWETVSKADVQMQKFNKKREEIEQQWGQAFMKFFTDLGADGKDAVKNLWQSVIGSMQEQIMQQFIQKALSGVFDSMASALTGVDPANVKAKIDAANLSAARTVETFAIQGVNTQMYEMIRLMMLFNNVMSQMTNQSPMWGEPGEGSTPGGMGGVIQSLGGMSGSAGGAGPFLSALSGNAASGSAGGSRGGGTWGGKGGMKTSWPAGTTALDKIFTGIGYGSMAGSLSGALTGRDPESSSTAGAIGGVIGGFVGGPIGALVGGFIGGLFGKKKKSTAPSPTRDIYGMPAFEYESYMYALTKTASTAGAGISPIIRLAPDYGGVSMDRLRPGGVSGSITINISGGDIAAVKKAVDSAITTYFGPTAIASAKRGSIYRT